MHCKLARDRPLKRFPVVGVPQSLYHVGSTEQGSLRPETPGKSKLVLTHSLSFPHTQRQSKYLTGHYLVSTERLKVRRTWSLSWGESETSHTSSLKPVSTKHKWDTLYPRWSCTAKMCVKPRLSRSSGLLGPAFHVQALVAERSEFWEKLLTQYLLKGRDLSM